MIFNIADTMSGRHVTEETKEAVDNLVANAWDLARRRE